MSELLPKLMLTGWKVAMLKRVTCLPSWSWILALLVASLVTFVVHAMRVADASHFDGDDDGLAPPL